MYVRVKEIRKKYGDTLQSLSEKIEYDYSNLSKVERGIYTPSLELLNKIATVYNISITELLVQPHWYDKKNLNLEDKELLKNYSVNIDGKDLSESELEFLIQSIRIFRQQLEKYID
ncbi:transcriptional regulator [Bacillus thuringiensis]|uniref:helix-turn-helix domain-containing protein n=1 Tax=Bacillus thuringiensis TaxID=1428 RepID=UPI000BF910A2|nr:helix-turn-helix transcriptional regulator [Bacillus thuringiensis]PFB52846.1 transcriptional regulator [Bacillus thuringiensis]